MFTRKLALMLGLVVVLVVSSGCPPKPASETVFSLSGSVYGSTGQVVREITQIGQGQVISLATPGGVSAVANSVGGWPLTLESAWSTIHVKPGFGIDVLVVDLITGEVLDGDGKSLGQYDPETKSFKPSLSLEKVGVEEVAIVAFIILGAAGTVIDGAVDTVISSLPFILDVIEGQSFEVMVPFGPATSSVDVELRVRTALGSYTKLFYLQGPTAPPQQTLTAMILAPEEGEAFQVGQEALFVANVAGGQGEVTLSWYFPDGTVGVGNPVRKTVSQALAGQTRLVVTDDSGQTAQDIVEVTVSSATVSVPDVRGKTVSEAQPILTGVGLAVGNVSQEHSATVAVGLIIRSNPIGGTAVSAGSSVDLAVSSGPIGQAEVRIISPPSGNVYHIGDTVSLTIMVKGATGGGPYSLLVQNGEFTKEGGNPKSVTIQLGDLGVTDAEVFPHPTFTFHFLTSGSLFMAWVFGRAQKGAERDVPDSVIP